MRYVLVPGAGGVAHGWSLVAEVLEAAGHVAVAVDLPADDATKGLSDYADIAVAAAGEDDVVLAAASLGGFTAALAAPRIPGLRAVVLVNAMIPVPDETPSEWGGHVGSQEARAAAARAGGYSPEMDDETYFWHDLPPDVRCVAVSLDRAQSRTAYEQRCPFTRWPAVPVHVLAGRDDRLFPAAFQATVARERLGVTADVIPGGHVMTLSNPRGVADYLLEKGNDLSATSARDTPRPPR